MHEVILYGKPGCHLCEDARALLDRLSTRSPLRIHEVDIRGDQELFRRYDVRIPVIVIDGRIELDAPITEAKLRQVLR
jgi:glutaredoxin